MMFSDFLKWSDAAQAVVVSQSGSLLVGDFHDLLSDGAEVSSFDFKPIKRATISLRDPASLVSALCMADGRFAEILLLAPCTDPAVAAMLMEKAGSEKLFSDHHQFGASEQVQSILAYGKSLESSAPISTTWLVATSGTTAKPKLVQHSLASLTRTAQLSDRPSKFVWGQLYGNYRFAGLQVILQAVMGQSTLIMPSFDATLASKLTLFAAHAVNALSATPTLWRKVLMTEESELLDLRSITLGGEIADQAILNALSKRFPEASIRHIYASTEAGAGFSVKDRKAGFPANYLKPGVGSRAGLKIEDGILFVENRMVTGAYVGSDKTFKDASGYVNTGDRVEVVDDRVYFLGRASGVINVGGDKVFPETVEAVLNAVDGVKISRAKGKTSALTGQLVVAEIVANGEFEKKQLLGELMSTAKERLPQYQRPVAYLFVDDIEVSDGGKVLRF